MTAPLHTPIVEVFIDGAWREVTPRYGGPDGRAVVITRGRGQGSTGTSPATCLMRLNNRDGELSPRNATGTYYGHLTRNTPIRVAIRTGATTGSKADASDDFSDNAVSSWASADVGGAWTTGGFGGTVAASNFDKTGGKGTHYVPAANAYRHCYLADLDIVDCTQVATLSVAQATGADLYGGLIFRHTGEFTYVMAKVSLTTANAVVVRIMVNPATDATVLGQATVSGLTHAGTGTPLKIKARSVARTFMVKVWAASGSEPDDWHLLATDTSAPVGGPVGIESGRATANTNTTDPQFSWDDYSVTVENARFCGEVPSWVPVWDGTARNIVIDIDAGGILRRLQRGSRTAPAAYVRTALGLVANGETLWGLWPLTDPSGSETAANAIPGSALSPVGSAALLTFGDDTTLPGLPGAVKVVASSVDGNLRGSPNRTAPAATSWSAAIWFKVVASGGSSEFDPLRIWTNRDNLNSWVISTRGSTNAINATAYDGDGVATALNVQVTSIDPHDGEWHFVVLDVDYDGATSTTATITVDASVQASDTASGAAFIHIGVPTMVETPNANHTPVTITSAHTAGLLLMDGTLSSAQITDLYDAGFGYVGETAADRIERLCAESRVAFALTGTAADSEPMGAQAADTLINLVTEAARTDDGILYEPRTFLGLAYRTRKDLYNQASALTLDESAYHFSEQPRPVDDDLLTANLVTASRAGGSSATAEKATGSLNTDDPADDTGGVGAYDATLSANTAGDSRLENLAGWAVAVGTVDQPRWPVLAVGTHRAPFRASQTLTDQVRAVDVDGQRVTIDNLPALVSTDSGDALLVGVEEMLDQFMHTLHYSAVPAEPWSNIAELDHATLGIVGSGGSTVNTAFVAGTGTSLSVAIAAGYPLWTTGSVDFDVRAGGVVLHVTSIAGASSPQTFTVDQATVNGVNKTIPVGEAVDVYPVSYIGA